MDLGAGDGSAVARRARRSPNELVIAIEPVGEQLRDASRRCARPASKGGLANALFLSGSAEDLPWLLGGRADELIVALPWAALLRAVALPDPAALGRLAQTLRPGGRLELLLSIAGRDAAGVLPALDSERARHLAAAYSALGFACRRLRTATRADVAQMSAGWGRRLGIPDRRAAFRLTFELAGGPPPPAEVGGAVLSRRRCPSSS